MFLDFDSIYQQMRADTWDHAAYQHLHKRLRTLREEYDAGAITRKDYALQVKITRTVYEMKQRQATQTKGLHLMGRGIH